MPFDQTKDVLKQARKFHHKLSEFYEDLKDTTDKERTRALLDYLSRHEQYLEDCLEEFQQDVSRNVLDSYFNMDPMRQNSAGSVTSKSRKR